MTESLGRPPLSQLIAGRIRELIEQGAFSEGDRLPSEYDLAATLGVGRSSIREAIQALAQTGVVRIARGRGTFVAAGATNAIRPFRWRERPTDRTFAELLEARQLLETALARLAAERAEKPDTEAIVIALAVHASSDPAGKLDSGYRFHSAIAAAAHNEVLLHLHESTSDLYHDLYRRLPGSATRAVDALVVEQHRRILEMIVARDGDAAAAEMAEHIRTLPLLYRSRALTSTPNTALGPSARGRAPVAQTGSRMEIV